MEQDREHSLTEDETKIATAMGIEVASMAAQNGSRATAMSFSVATAMISGIAKAIKDSLEDNGLDETLSILRKHTEEMNRIATGE